MKTTEPCNTILLVDDEEDIRAVLQLALEDAGYRVLNAENGQKALAMFKRHRPPIVITDIKMPIVDGIELLQHIKRSAAETEVIMITGHGDMDLAVKSLKHEATDFITKPINVDALEIALQRVRERIIMREKLHAYTTHLEALIREKSELQDHLSSLGLMIGSISHGIKGLLTALDGGIYLLEGGLRNKDPDRIKEGLDTVQHMVERIRKMVMDILFYAKKRDLHWEQLDLLQFTKEAARMMQLKLADLPIKFERQLPESAGNCRIDPGYVHAALMNIFENAIDACQRDSSKTTHSIHFGLHVERDQIIFTLSDDGIGMDADTQSKLFTEFFSSKGRKGTGLGLFLANKVISQHGGRICVRSRPGQGSTFTIHLPTAGEPTSD